MSQDVKTESAVLDFWGNGNYFKKSVEDLKNTSRYVFYDGPPFANGLPHYGHLLTGFVKDTFARYHAMLGERCDRVFGWDCHGLPAEMEAEKELKITGRLAIKEYGIDKFNEHCKTSVMKYTNEWKDYVTKQGRWVDFDNSYKTMDKSYMESVIWAFKELYKKGLIYESTRVMPYSWKCETPLSNFETKMDNSYREKESKTCTVKFKLTDESFEKLKQIISSEGIKKGIKADNQTQDKTADFLNSIQGKHDKDVQSAYLLAWTTTPWTLPSNLALAVGADIQYCVIQKGEEYLVIAENLAGKYNKELYTDGTQSEYIINGTLLQGLEYEPLFPYFKNTPNAFRVLTADFVSTEDGTGIVHMAPAFGEDDFNLCRENGISVICPVDDGGKFNDARVIEIKYSLGGRDEILSLQNRCVLEERTSEKGKKDYDGVNEDIIKYLKSKNLWLKTEQYFHNYPHCWRTDTPLIYKAVSSWYVNVAGDGHNEAKIATATGEKTIKQRMMELNSGFSNETRRLKMIGLSIENIDDLSKIFPDKSREKLESWIDDAKFQAIINKETGEFIGIASLGDIKSASQLNGKIEIGYGIKQEFRNNGFGTEIATRLLKNALSRYSFDQIFLTTQEDNPASRKVAEKIGMKFSHKTNHNGTDVLVYKIEERDAKNIKEGINWIPNHIRDGQFGKWLEGARDWSISRNRFFGCPIPVWRSENPNNKEIYVFGSIAEMEEFFNTTITDLHRPYIDELVAADPHDPRYKIRRIEDVFDCWFESGAMPFASIGFKGEKDKPDNFPADFIVEYVAQTRGWFYTLMILSTALFDLEPFKNCICHGVILDSNGQKLSKRLRNYPDPMQMFDQYGSDAMRWFMLRSPVMRGNELYMDKDGEMIRDAARMTVNALLSAYNFFLTYARIDNIQCNDIIVLNIEPVGVMNSYILSYACQTVLKIQDAMDAYDTPSACIAFEEFLESLNNWYIRRSKDIFWSSQNTPEKQEAFDTLYSVLLNTSKAVAPMLPFTTEIIWQGLIAASKA